MVKIVFGVACFSAGVPNPGPRASLLSHPSLIMTIHLNQVCWSREISKTCRAGTPEDQDWKPLRLADEAPLYHNSSLSQSLFCGVHPMSSDPQDLRSSISYG